MATTPSTPSAPGIVKQSLLRNAYERLQADSTKDTLSFEAVIGSDSQVEKIELARQYQERLLATIEESPSGHLFINGKYYPFANVSIYQAHIVGILADKQHWTSLVQNELSSQIALLQEHLSSGYPVLDISTLFYDLPGVPSRRSKLIVPTTGEYGLKAVNVLELFERDTTKRLQTDFMYPSELPRRLQENPAECLQETSKPLQSRCG